MAQTLSLDDLKPHPVPPPERGPVVPVQVERWRQEALALEHGDGGEPDDAQAAHQITLSAGGARSELMLKGQKATLQFDAEGNIAYHRGLHPTMKGTIEVAARR